MTNEPTAPTASPAFPTIPTGPVLESVAVFCGNCSCGCPELFLDHGADTDHKVMLTDDFGQRVQMSVAQLAILVADVKGGVLDHLVA
jgi:hypothetical protein